jgi:tetratricopeptide (TPR) repeat protein
MKKLLIECPRCGASKYIPIDAKIFKVLSPTLNDTQEKNALHPPQLSLKAGEVCAHAFTAILSHGLSVLGYECESMLHFSPNFMELLETDYMTRSSLRALTDVLQKGFEGPGAATPEFQRYVHDHLTKIFEGELILNDSKVKIFELLSLAITAENYPLYYEDFLRYRDYTKELADIETLYYTIKTEDNIKMREISDRVQTLLDTYPRFFLPWFILGNMLAIQDRNPEAIQAFLEAQKYRTNLGNLARLANNLLVCYFNSGDYSSAKAYSDALSPELRSYPHIRDLRKEMDKKMKRVKEKMPGSK